MKISAYLLVGCCELSVSLGSWDCRFQVLPLLGEHGQGRRAAEVLCVCSVKEFSGERAKRRVGAFKPVSTQSQCRLAVQVEGVSVLGLCGVLERLLPARVYFLVYKYASRLWT